ncbi:MAG: AAA family ATPase [candidate division KSB1 bacterium]|nr:AAA family ATPase [candidate division KSB1 bacterium]MDZ7367015.1 AAA family ATPase [candidate division KSB1 bacterium]
MALITGEVGSGKSTALRTFTETLDKNHHGVVYIDDPTLLIIDDAQHLKPQALKELRLLTNFHIESKAPLSLMLLAQPEFRKVVQLKALQAFNQRLTLHVHLTGLVQSEAAAYVKHQLEIAGRTDMLFTDDVIAEIYQQAKGIPRVDQHLVLRMPAGYLPPTKKRSGYADAGESAVSAGRRLSLWRDKKTPRCRAASARNGLAVSGKKFVRRT